MTELEIHPDWLSPAFRVMASFGLSGGLNFLGQSAFSEAVILKSDKSILINMSQEVATQDGFTQIWAG
jgi:hypothetical protein